MAYARMGSDSDVYVFFNYHCYYECMGCALERPDPWLKTAAEMLAHLEAHAAAGHKTGDAIEALREEVGG